MQFGALFAACEICLQRRHEDVPRLQRHCCGGDLCHRQHLDSRPVANLCHMYAFNFLVHMRHAWLIWPPFSNQMYGSAGLAALRDWSGNTGESLVGASRNVFWAVRWPWSGPCWWASADLCRHQSLPYGWRSGVAQDRNHHTDGVSYQYGGHAFRGCLLPRRLTLWLPGKSIAQISW